MEKPISSLKLGLTFAGCFLGAGYVSGREMWQFFGRFGVWGWLGLALALGTLAALGAVTLLLARRTGETDLGRLVIPWELPWLRTAVTVFSLVFLFGVDSIMTAGVGALFRQLLGLSEVWTSLVFSLIVALCTLTGLEGMVTAFSVTVPILTVAAAALSGASLALVPAEPAPPPATRGWLFSAVTFAAYNMFSSVAILSPLGDAVRTGKGLRRGLLVGAGLLLAIAGPILLTLGCHGFAVTEPLPMLEVVKRLSPALALGFGGLLLLAMFGTAFSSFLTAVNQLPGRLSGKPVPVFLLAGLVWAASLFGFGTLIDFIYPVFGVCSAGFLLCMLWHFFHRGK